MVLTSKRPPENDDPVLLTGATAAALMNAAETVERSGLSSRQSQIKGNRLAFEVSVRNDTEENLRVGHVVGLGDPVIKPEDDERVRFVEPRWPGEVPGDQHLGRFAVMVTPVPAGKRFGTAVYRGVCWAYIRFDEQNDMLCRADIDEGVHEELVPHPAGGAEILYKPPGTGRKLCLVSVESQPPVLVYGAASGDIQPDSDGKMLVSGAGRSDGYEIDVSLRRPHGNEKISDGKDVGAIWSPCERLWSVLLADCEITNG